MLNGHGDLVRCLRFDAKRIVSGAYDGKIMIWDMVAALDEETPDDKLCIGTMEVCFLFENIFIAFSGIFVFFAHHRSTPVNYSDCNLTTSRLLAAHMMIPSSYGIILITYPNMIKSLLKMSHKILNPLLKVHRCLQHQRPTSDTQSPNVK